MIRTWIRHFLRDERGMEEVEICVVAGILALIGVLIFIQIGHDSQGSLTSLGSAIQAVASQTAP